MIDHIKDFFFISDLYALLYKTSQVNDLSFGENRYLGRVRFILTVVDWIQIRSKIIVQKSAWNKTNLPILDRRIIVCNQFCIGPRLVRRMHDFSHCASGICFYQSIRILDFLKFTPLF